MTNETIINEKLSVVDSLKAMFILDKINLLMDAAREDEAVGFGEWISDNQFTRYNHEWTSTKIHYPGCVYTTTELYQLYLKHKNEKK